MYFNPKLRSNGLSTSNAAPVPFRMPGEESTVVMISRIESALDPRMAGLAEAKSTLAPWHSLMAQSERDIVTR
eukprot:scaffold289903_cov35-Tisochrysis_lutea.AAC.2